MYDTFGMPRAILQLETPPCFVPDRVTVVKRTRVVNDVSVGGRFGTQPDRSVFMEVRSGPAFSEGRTRLCWCMTLPVRCRLSRYNLGSKYWGKIGT